ncbi:MULTISPECIES: hypothetical protein [Dysgonomonas]|uniref:Uncharacterized protein n=1 Tax=Dysgonomonas mossii TaxID=163665 RepID=A0A4Y9IJP2_9BACT|nr:MULTISPECIES: hypothetical protein [Dysgonomonas]MBF0762759.1 hypothetical protein [Dysgonomonas mossii]MBN9303402.1 hypothetical protein [Dysgonomonas mossii]TFU86259.1 hypothetical protein E4T88_17155 [Dysgonomonas mossii]
MIGGKVIVIHSMVSTGYIYNNTISSVLKMGSVTVSPSETRTTLPFSLLLKKYLKKKVVLKPIFS